MSMDTFLQEAAAKPPSPDKIRWTYYIKTYPQQIWYLIVCFIAFVSLCRFLSFLHSRYSRGRTNGTMTDLEQKKAPVRHGLSFRRIPIAAINAYRVIAFRWTLQIGKVYTLNLAEVFLTCAYIVALFTWEFINTTTYAGQRFSPSYWANRATSIASIQLPLITALGTKNNVISVLTGVSFEKLNYLHRMMSRVVMILIWVHAGGRIKIAVESDSGDGWFRAGVMSAAALTLLILISIKPIRARSYELFFYLHCSMVLMILVGAYYHTKKFAFDAHVWPSFVIWGLDRLIRFVRLVIFNHSYFGFKSGSGTLDAKTELLSDGLIRLTLRRPSHFHWTPGQMAYLILPGVSTLPFEAHPFTIASLNSSSSAKDTVETKNVADEASSNASADVFWKELVFFINVQKGFTKKLAKVASQNGTVKAFVDGPYGITPDLCPFDTCVLVAGGTGVSYTLPNFLDILERVHDGTSNCRKVVFIWSIRDWRHAQYISETLTRALEHAPSSLEISVRIHITTTVTATTLREEEEGSAHSRAETFQEKSNGPLQAFMFEGRPDIAALLRDEAGLTNGRMSVSVCGSQSIAHAVRCALRFPASNPANILRGGPSISLFMEVFGYA